MAVNKTTAPFGRGGNVVANGEVGLDAPLRVTVGTFFASEGGVTEGVADGARIVNWLEVAYMTPMVEFMNMR